MIPTITVRNEICVPDWYATLYRRPYILVWNTKFVRGTRTTCTSETLADDNPPVVNSRSTVGSIVGERSDDDSGNLELVQGGPNGPEMIFKASGVEGNGGVLIHRISILNKIEFFEKNTQNSVKKVPINPIRISRHRSAVHI